MLLNLLLNGRNEGKEIYVKSFQMAILGDTGERFVTLELVDTEEDDDGNLIIIMNIFDETKIARMEIIPSDFDALAAMYDFIDMEIDETKNVYPIRNKNLYPEGWN